MSEPEASQEFEALLEYLHTNRGFDFTGYKRTSLMRRVNKRMELVNMKSYPDYVDFLEVHPEEFGQLFNTILINVTSFFRDPPAWEYLAQELLPQMLKSKHPPEPIRVWCPGCASGEEAYTIAILLTELVGEQAFLQRVKIYATDLDDHALQQARLAGYSGEGLETVPEVFRKKYFDQVNGSWMFRTDLRRAIIFGRHDLLQDAPISRLDLLICRNTLMYFNLESQAQILRRFHFALGDTGILFLGKAETLLPHSNLYAPIELRYRIFAKVPQPVSREQMFELVPSAPEPPAHASLDRMRTFELAIEHSPAAQLIIDANGNLSHANDRAREMLGIAARVIGRPFSELEVSYRPVELRSRIEQAMVERRVVSLPDVERRLTDGKLQYLDVHLAPLQDVTGYAGILVSFVDVTRRHELQNEILHSKQDLATAYEEMQSSNEELETSNEELQSTIEELQTTNEELQSTNEELETMNEELQSTNEAIESTNSELRLRTNELNEALALQGSILSSIRYGLVVMDRNYNVVIWNHEAEELWGLRADEVKGQSFFNLDIGLPVHELAGIIRNAVSSDGNPPSAVIIDATNRRGRNFKCQVTASPRLGPQAERQGIILTMEEYKK